MVTTPPVIFTGNANPGLARGLTSRLGLELGRAHVGSFDDEEVRIQVDTDVRGQDVFIVQPTNQPDRYRTELELMVRAIRSSARHITAVIPYLGYGRQDRKSVPREPISIVQVLRNVIHSGIDGLILVDLHAGQLMAVCEAIDARLRVDHIYSRPVILDWLSGQNLEHAIISSIDAGGAKMVESYLKRLHPMGHPVTFGVAHKSGSSAIGINGITLLGDVDGRDVYFIDDMVTSGRSATEGALEAKRRGAKSVTFIASHAVLANLEVAHRIADSPIDRFVVTNTIAVKQEHREVLGSKLIEVRLDDLLALVIKHLHEGRSVSKLFELAGYRECRSELQAV